MEVFMKIFILGLIFVSANGFAQEGGSFFQSTGSKQCESDCSVAADEAKIDAEANAKIVCNPLTALRVSDWKTSVTGYGRLVTTAIFSCKTEGTK